MALSTTRMKVFALGFVIILAPVVYLAVLNQVIPHPGLEFHAGWADDSFQEDMWKLSFNRPVEANLSSVSGVLKVHVSGNLTANTIVAAQRFSGLDFNLATYRYLKVLVMTSGLDVAARIVVWTDSDHGYAVLTKTYNDYEWHTEVFDIVYLLNGLGMSGSQLVEIELSLEQVSQGSNSTVWYSQLSFNSLEAA